MKKKLFMMGVLTLITIGVFVGLSKKTYVYHSDVNNVEKIRVDSDISNIVLVQGDSNMNIKYTGQKSFLGTPKINIVYNNDQAIINVKAIPNKWMYILPGNVKRGELILSIPSALLEQVQINTQNGNIDVKDISEVNNLALNSRVGNIHVDSFNGKSVDIGAKNGSIKLGTIQGEVKIKNQTGNLNSLVLSDIKGKNIIKLANGSVKITLPNKSGFKDIGFNISTKNGKILSENHTLTSDTITKQGAGQNILIPSKGNHELNISVAVGNIKIH